MNQIIINQNMIMIASYSPLKLLEYLETVSGTQEFKIKQQKHYDSYIQYQIELKQKQINLDASINHLKGYQPILDEIKHKTTDLSLTLSQLKDLYENQLNLMSI